MIQEGPDNPNSLKDTDSGSCSVCRGLLTNMEQFFDVLQNTRNSIAPNWLTVAEVASELRISKTVVYRLIRSGELEAINIVDNVRKIAQKGHYRVNRSSLTKYVESKKVNPLPDESHRRPPPRQFPSVKNHLGI